MAIIRYFDFNSDMFFYKNLLITTDRGYPEAFNYVQLAVVAWLMFYVFFRTRQGVYVSLAIVFLIALGEDALHLHERVGEYAESNNLPAPAFFDSYHLG